MPRAKGSANKREEHQSGTPKPAISIQPKRQKNPSKRYLRTSAKTCPGWPWISGWFVFVLLRGLGLGVGLAFPFPWFSPCLRVSVVLIRLFQRRTCLFFAFQNETNVNPRHTRVKPRVVQKRGRSLLQACWRKSR